MNRISRVDHRRIRGLFATSNGLPAKKDVYDGEAQAVTAFISEVRTKIFANNGLGDIYPSWETQI